MSAHEEENKPDLANGIPSESCSEGRMVAGTLDGQPALVLRHNGSLCALSASCTHLGAPLEKGLLVDGELRCPWHHARFNVATGEAIAAPAFEPLTRYAVSERDGTITVGAELARSAPAEHVLDGRVVIIGAGAAGHACAEMLARSGLGARVTLIGDEANAPYDRTFCSKQYLAGRKSRDEATLPGLDVTAPPALLTGIRVTSIDVDEKTATLDNDETISWSYLVIATGAAPVEPEFKGADHANVFRFRTIADADSLISAAGSAKKAAVIGASFIGLEVAASLRSRKLEVTVVAPDQIPLVGKMGEEVGRYVQGLHADKGVQFRLGRKAKSYDGRHLVLDDGSTVEADMVVAGIGVKPRVNLAKAAGLAIAGKDEGGGVLVDEHLLTGAPNVYAIGDIASFPEARLGETIRVEHWVHAQRQGQFVARHIMGEAARYLDTPFFWSGHYDQSLRYVGRGVPKDCQIDGKVEDDVFSVRYAGAGAADHEAALLTCGRDMDALQQEADWDAEAASKLAR